MTSSGELRVAIIGYGLSGRVFHAPLISATPGMSVTSVVTSDSTRAARVSRDLPAARVLSVTDDLWSRREEHDLVVVATSTGSHVALATKAVDLGLAVVVEKPLAPSAPTARALVEHAERNRVLLSPFHNRRWDSDHLTLQRLVAEGSIGEVMRYESRFERWRPEPDPGAWRETTPPEQGGGLLLDLGVHLVDQALELFGPPLAVYAEILSRRGGTDDDVFIALSHAGGVRSHIWAGALAGAPGPRLRVLGRRAAFVVEGLDGQEDALRAGHSPDEAAFGMEPEERWGRLRRGDAGEPVRSEQGRWIEFYARLASALREGGPPPVEPREALFVLEALDAARTSADTGEIVRFDR